ncbi:MAG: hypothetical protein LBR10_12205 [Prevotellaceae bacterium]|jgi:hypothetical protein|nr:hypothetical protein [Prevotellaceae bacterium]
MNNSNKKCLLLLTRYPYPPIGGDKLKSYNLVKILSKNYDLKVIVITDEVLTDEVKTFLTQNTSSFSTFKKPKMLCMYHAFIGIFKKEPIQISYYYSKSIHKKIKHDIYNADILIANLVRTVKYVMHEKKRKYWDIVDAIGLHYVEAAKRTSSLFWKILYTVEGRRLLKYEQECVGIFDNTFFVNKHESDIYSKYGVTTWIPNGVNENLFTYEINSNKKTEYSFFGENELQT